MFTLNGIANMLAPFVTQIAQARHANPYLHGTDGGMAAVDWIGAPVQAAASSLY